MKEIYSKMNYFQIATSLVDDAVVCYNTALCYYGYGDFVTRMITVGSKKGFVNFEYDDYEYMFVKYDNYSQVNYDEKDKIRVTSLEKTIVDCIDKSEYTNVDELVELINSDISLDENRIIDALDSYGDKLLYKKVGYLFDYFKKHHIFSDAFYEKCKSYLTEEKGYLFPNAYSNYKYDEKWGIMVPDHILVFMDCWVVDEYYLEKE